MRWLVRGRPPSTPAALPVPVTSRARKGLRLRGRLGRHRGPGHGLDRARPREGRAPPGPSPRGLCAGRLHRFHDHHQVLRLAQALRHTPLALAAIAVPSTKERRARSRLGRVGLLAAESVMAHPAAAFGLPAMVVVGSPRSASRLSRFAEPSPVLAPTGRRPALARVQDEVRTPAHRFSPSGTWPASRHRTPGRSSRSSELNMRIWASADGSGTVTTTCRTSSGSRSWSARPGTTRPARRSGFASWSSKRSCRCGPAGSCCSPLPSYWSAAGSPGTPTSSGWREGCRFWSGRSSSSDLSSHHRTNNSSYVTLHSSASRSRRPPPSWCPRGRSPERRRPGRGDVVGRPPARPVSPTPALRAGHRTR